VKLITDHVAGSDNEHADVASRAAEEEVHAKLAELLRADKTGNFTPHQIPVASSVEGRKSEGRYNR
jgi:hypothetical protein